VGAAVAQEEDQLFANRKVSAHSESQWFDSWLLCATCQNILGQDTEPLIVSDASIGV